MMRMTGMARTMRITTSRMSAPALALAVLIALACGGGDAAPDAPPADGAPDVLQILMASTDLAVGENRVAFGLLRPGEGALKNADVEPSDVLSSGRRADGPRSDAVAGVSPMARRRGRGVYRQRGFRPSGRVGAPRGGKRGGRLQSARRFAGGRGGDQRHPRHRRARAQKREQDRRRRSEPRANYVRHVARRRPLPQDDSGRSRRSPPVASRLRHARLLSHRHLRAAIGRGEKPKEPPLRARELHPRRSLRQPRRDSPKRNKRGADHPPSWKSGDCQASRGHSS